MGILHDRIVEGNLEDVKRILNNDVDIHETGEHSNTPLMVAIKHGRNSLAIELINRGSYINKENLYGDRPLHFAARYGMAEVALHLLDRGVRVDIQNDYLFTPLHYAVSHRHHILVGILLDNGANIGIGNSQGDTAKQIAMEKGDIITVVLMEEQLRRHVDALSKWVATQK